MTEPLAAAAILAIVTAAALIGAVLHYTAPENPDPSPLGTLVAALAVAVLNVVVFAAIVTHTPCTTAASGSSPERSTAPTTQSPAGSIGSRRGSSASGAPPSHGR